MTVKHADETLDLLADVAATFATPDPERVRAVRDEGGAIDREMWSRIAENGWLGILVPEDRGGAGLGLDAVAIVARRLGYGCFPEPFVAAGVLAPLVLAACDEDDVLGGVIAGDLLVGIGWQFDVVAEGTIDGPVLTGTSRFIPVAGADAFVIAARSPGGTGLHWVPADAKDLTVADERCADGTLSASLDLAGVAARELIPSPRGGEALDAALDSARIAVAAELVGIGDRVMELTLEYLRGRKQFGKPIGSFQALQHRAVDAWMQLSLATAALDAAVAIHLDPDSSPRARAAAASSAKSRASAAIPGDLLDIPPAARRDRLHRGVRPRPLHQPGTDAGALARRRRRAPPSVRGPDRCGRGLGMTAQPDRDLNALSDDQFRALVRADIEEHYPPHLRYSPHRVTWDEQSEWIDHLIERGWIAPGWPVEHGGLGLSPLKQIIFREEHERWGASEYREHGVIQVGPVIMRFGTDQQKERWLPPVLRGEHHWAQGYSEPEAGSDLASLRTRARRDGDEYVVDGQKTWTTLAQAATHIYLLVRTDPDAKKQEGISFLLADIDTPGITVQPIVDIAGHVDFCEVFLADVRIPVENRVGEENQGWTIAKSLLGHERLTAGSPGASEYGLQVLAAVARARGVDSDPVFRDRYAQLRLDVAHHRDAYAGYKDMIARGEEIGPDVSMLKILATETFAEIADFIIETAGDAGALAGNVRLGENEIDVLQAFYKARPAMIYAGSNEIQRNIIATAVLDLPRG